MKKIFTFLLFVAISFSSCRKEKNFFPEKAQLPETEACKIQTVNPAGRSYSGRSVIPFNYYGKNCGIIPLSIKNYWVYQDSIYHDGIFNTVKYDTLRFVSTWKTLGDGDGLIWWGSNINIGVPELLYANDSAFFGLESRLFSPTVVKDVKKEFSLFSGDSLNFLTSFEDVAAKGRSLKIYSALKTPAGTFADCFYFEKNADAYRKDQLILKPGVGVLKYIHERAPIGQRVIKLQKVLTLVAFYIE